MCPKFSAEYDALLNDSLQKLGMSDAFDGEKADFNDEELEKPRARSISKLLLRTEHSRRQDNCTARTHKTIIKNAAAPFRKKYLP